MDITTEATSNKSLTTQAFELLRSDILVGRLLPEERLRIHAVSERYGIGSTAIREALSRLTSDGLVEFEDQRGFCVAPVSREELLDLTRTRTDIECLALRYAIRAGDVEWESRLLSAFHRLVRTPPPDSADKHAAWSLVHRQFHEALISGCDSPWLLRLCHLLYDKSERYRNLAERRKESRRRDVDAEHRSLMDAAMARDGDKACALLAGHFKETADIILRSDIKVAGANGAVRPSGRRAKT